MTRSRFVATFLWMLAAALLPQAALAHAALVGSEPAAGTTVATSPPQVTLSFDEPVAALVMKLVAPEGAVTDLVSRPSGSKLALTLPAALGQGSYIVSWRVTSADGHPVGGSFIFSVGAVSRTGAGLDSSDFPLAVAIWVVRILFYVGLLIGVGGAFGARFLGVATSGYLRWTLTAGLALGLWASIAAAALQGLDALDFPLGAALTSSVWRAGVEGGFGRQVGTAALSMLLALVSLGFRRSGIATILATLAMLGPGLALVASGHAATAPLPWLSRSALFLHAISVAFWIGALLPLGAALRAGETAPLLRFSRTIVPVVAALAVTGLFLAIVELSEVSALWQTPYGRVLIAKLAAVLLLLAIAAWNRRSLTPRIEHGEEISRQELIRSIRDEVLLALLIFALVAGWRFTPPPRTLDRPLAAIDIHLHGDKAMAEVEITPYRSGRLLLDLLPLDGDGVPFKPQEVAVSLADAAGSTEPIRLTAMAVADGHWSVETPALPLGEKNLTVELLIDDFEKATLAGDIPASPR